MQATSIKRGPVTIRAKNPVISGRVSESLLRKVRASAKKSGRSLSEELAFRADQSFAWEEAFVSIQKLFADAKSAIAGELGQALREASYTPIHTSGGIVWAEPESAISKGYAEEVKKWLGEMKGQP
jgi:hypothetical protein